MRTSKSNQSIVSGGQSVNLNAERDININLNYPTALADDAIVREVDRVRRKRFFPEFDRYQQAKQLGRKLSEGDLAGASDAVRARALAWCARILAPSDELDKARELLATARDIHSCPEVAIAGAFIKSQEGDRQGALQDLSALESPESRTAALQIVSHHDGPNGAATWFSQAGLGPEDLDAEGNHVLLSSYLQSAQYDLAVEAAALANEAELDAAPVLIHTLAKTYLFAAVPDDLRDFNSLQLVPFDTTRFRLKSSPEAMEARRRAHEYFVRAATTLMEMDLPAIAAINDEFALWLELTDPETAEGGKQRLTAALDDPKTVLPLVRLGFQFGIDIDAEKIEREIDRQTAANGGPTYETASARLALAISNSDGKKSAEYIEKYFDQLEQYINAATLYSFQVDMFTRAGLSEKASACLFQAIAAGLPKDDERRLRALVEDAEGNDRAKILKEQYESTNELIDLVNLAAELQSRNDWEPASEYLEVMYERTEALKDFGALVAALKNAGNFARIVELCQDHKSLVHQDDRLGLYFAWALYYCGQLTEARTEATRLDALGDDPNFRALKVNIAVTSGEWTALLDIVADEFRRRDALSAEDLMQSAMLALYVDSPHAKDLVQAAAEKGKDDPAIQAAAYTAASNAGWEDDPSVHGWLERAISLSGEDGPMKSMSIQDLVDRKPEWDRRVSEVQTRLGNGEIPMFVAAEALNRSLVSMMLVPAYSNPTESDPRRTALIPAYSGARRELTPEKTASIGFDATALLTFSYLGLLDAALDAFDQVYIPHSTLPWLFEERRRASFHQPSRIREAHKIRDLLSNDKLERFVTSTTADGDLSDEIGEELAKLIAEAEIILDGDATKRFVVRTSPIHKVSSLMEDEADVSRQAGVLVSSHAIISKLQEKAAITAQHAEQARAYLSLHDRPWPDEPQLPDSAVLYLDDLAVTHLYVVGVLDRLKGAGYQAILSPRKEEEVNALISYGNLEKEINDSIERIRSSLATRIDNGKVKVYGKDWHGVDRKEDELVQNPTFGTVRMAAACDAVIMDDRFVNQHKNIEDATAKCPIYSSVDVLNKLLVQQSISREVWLEKRTALRQSGYIFMPLHEDELFGHVLAAPYSSEGLRETLELRAIRENIFRILMGGWLAFPKDVTWIDNIQRVLFMVFRRVWLSDCATEQARACARWLTDIADIKLWAGALGPEYGANLLRNGVVPFVGRLAFPPVGMPDERTRDYQLWFDSEILEPFKVENPDLYQEFLLAQLDLIRRFSEPAGNDEDGE